MQLKMRLRTKDIIKLLFGNRILVLDRYNDAIWQVQKGKDTYVAKQ
jgi:hypothetical protein